MILESVIAQVAEQQKARLEVKDPGLKRELEPAVKSLSSHAIAELVQVCYELTPDNLDRELNGLMGAMRFFNMPEATIVTYSGKDVLKKEGFTIRVVPAYTFLRSDET